MQQIPPTQVPAELPDTWRSLHLWRQRYLAAPTPDDLREFDEPWAAARDPSPGRNFFW